MFNVINGTSLIFKLEMFVCLFVRVFVCLSKRLLNKETHQGPDRTTSNKMLKRGGMEEEAVD